MSIVGLADSTAATGLAISLAIFVLLIYVLRCIRMPAATAFLFAGIAAGPYGLGFVQNPQHMHDLLEVGALLLFFLLGSHVRVARLGETKPYAVAATLQVGLTAAAVVGALALLGVGWQESLFTGFLASVGGLGLVNVLRDGRSSDTSGRAAIGCRSVLLVHAGAVVCILLVIPVLAGIEGAASRFPESAFMMLAFSVFILMLSPLLVPDHLEGAVRKRGPLGWLAGVLIVASAVVLIFALAGLGVAVGAFMAGVMLSESRCGDRRISEMLPLRLVAACLFYAALGMLLDFRFLAEHGLVVLVAAGALFGLKKLAFRAGVLAVGPGRGFSPTAGLAFLPAVECAFLLFYAGREVGLTPAGAGALGEQGFVCVAALVLGASVLFTNLRPSRAVQPGRMPSRLPPAAGRLTDHAAVPRFEEHVCTRALVQAARRSARRRTEATGDEEAEMRPIWNPSDGSRLCLRAVTVEAGSLACDRTMAELGLRRRLGVEVLSLWRGDIYYECPRPAHALMPDDHVVLSGTPVLVSIGSRLFRNMPYSAPSDSEVR